MCILSPADSVNNVSLIEVVSATSNVNTWLIPVIFTLPPKSVMHVTIETVDIHTAATPPTIDVGSPITVRGFPTIVAVFVSVTTRIIAPQIDET